jgi:hypothetical protein
MVGMVTLTQNDVWRCGTDLLHQGTILGSHIVGSMPINGVEALIYITCLQFFEGSCDSYLSSW